MRLRFWKVRPLWLGLALTLWSAAPGFELREVRIKALKGKAFAEIEFSQSSGEKGFPLFFHQSDIGAGILTVSFLETGSAFPLGDYVIDAGGEALSKLGLKRFRSPSGKTFLGLEFHLANPPKRVVLDEKGKAAVRIDLEAPVAAKFNWSLAQTAKGKAAEAKQLVEKPKPVPAEKSAPPAPQASPPKTASVAATPGKSGLQEIRLLAGSAQETLILDFGSVAPEFSAGKTAGDSTWLTLSFPSRESTGRKEYVFPHNGVFRKARLKSVEGKLTAEIQAQGGGMLHVIPQGNEIHITSAAGTLKKTFKWSSNEPNAKVLIADALPDPIEGAHDQGKTLEKVSGTQSGKGVSSSEVFSPAGESKPMIIRKDSVSFHSSPGAKSKATGVLEIGEVVVKVGQEKGWLRVVRGNDTGYVADKDATYADEVGAEEAQRIRQVAEAKATKAQALSARVQAESQVKTQPVEPARAKSEPAVMVAEPKEIPLPKEAPKSAPLPTNAMAQKLVQEKKAVEEEKIKVKLAEDVTYNSYGRRDPFVPVEPATSENGIIIDQMKVVGIIWKQNDPIAVLEHTKESGLSFTVRQGDPVHNGRVSRITRDAVTFAITEYGISRSYSLKLVSQEGVSR